MGRGGEAPEDPPAVEDRAADFRGDRAVADLQVAREVAVIQVEIPAAIRAARAGTIILMIPTAQTAILTGIAILWIGRWIN